MGALYRKILCETYANARNSISNSYATQAYLIVLAIIPEPEEQPMQDILWITIMAGLVAATLAYVRLCDNA